MTTPVETATDRHRVIADRLEALGRVEVADLAVRLDVAPETIRRDLKLLEQQGLLQRVHGGAVRRAERPLSPFDGTSPQHPEHHRRLADQVVSRLPHQGSIFLDASPLTSAVADALARRSCPATADRLIVVTTSLDAAVVLSRVDQLHVFNVGGTVDQNDRSQHGEWTLSELRRVRIDLALLSATGVTSDAGIFVATSIAAATTAAVIGSAARVWLLVEPEAVGRQDFMIAASLDRIDEIFIAGQPDPARLAALAEAQVEITVDTG